MSGGEQWESRGIIPLTFSHVFKQINQIERQNMNENLKIEVFVSYFEIYNENGYDLLDKKHADTPFEKWNKISVYEDIN